MYVVMYYQYPYIYLIQIFPSEIDNVLLSHPGVVDSATVAVDQPDAGQVPYCFVVPTNKDTVTERMLKQTLHGKYIF